jgi:hypothetical protein
MELKDAVEQAIWSVIGKLALFVSVSYFGARIGLAFLRGLFENPNETLLTTAGVMAGCVACYRPIRLSRADFQTR